MMAKKKWFALLCFHISYLFLGACIYYNIENPLETEKLIELRKQIVAVQRMVYTNYLPSTELSTNTEAQIDLLTKLSDICGEPMAANLSLDEPVTPIWDFYHAFFFSYTVVSTIGYGNLAPTTSLGRIIMIFYALLGVPVNAILFANLGAYFASTFKKIYSRYKERNPYPSQEIDYTIRRFGLIGQLIMYFIPGVIIFIFLPACLFVIFEGWDYVLAVYYAFVTLTTIGFGDYVAAIQDNGFGIYFQFYKAFLIFWITFGLGYIGMCIGFLIEGLKSKKIQELEKKLAKNLKVTQSKIWGGVSKDVGYLRKILNEVTIMRYKPVYRDEIPAPRLHRSSSCPEFSLNQEASPTYRPRANSEVMGGRPLPEFNRTQSDTDLLAIDRKKTFENGPSQAHPVDLLARVVDALGSIRNEDVDEYPEKGIHGFSDSQILESEKMGSGWSIGGSRLLSDTPPPQRSRAVSEIKTPMILVDSKPYANGGDWSWSGSSSPDKFRDGQARLRSGKLSMPNVAIPEMEPPRTPTSNILSRLNPFKRRGSRAIDVESERSPDNDTMTPEDYLKITSRGRPSMAPPPPFQPQMFLNMTNNDTTPEDYLQRTAKGRYSMTPIQPQRYLNNTRSGRASRISTSSDNAEVLEKTTVADLIRAIEALHSGAPTDLPKRRKGTVTPPMQSNPLVTLTDYNTSRHLSAGINQSNRDRRPSFSALPPALARRRLSLLPTSGNLPTFTPTISPLAMESPRRERSGSGVVPPPYSPSDAARRRALGAAGRRLSLFTSAPSPRSRRHVGLTLVENIPLGGRSRDNSLPEIKIHKPSSTDS